MAKNVQLKSIRRPCKVTFWLREPKENDRRKTFSIQFRVCYPDKTEKDHGVFEDKRTETLNEMLSKQKKDAISVGKEFRKIIKELQERELQLRGKLPISSENNIVFEKFWEIKYAGRSNIDLDTARNETIRAIEAVGNLPLLSASQNDIQKAVDKYCGTDANKQRRIIARLRSILRAVGRTDIQLRREKPVHNDVHFLTKKEFSDLIDFIRLSNHDKIAGIAKSSYIAFLECLFYSGLRIGEAFYIKQIHFDPKTRILKVEHQLNDKFQVVRPKWGKTRKAVIPKAGVKGFLNWVNATDRDKIKRTDASKKLKFFSSQKFKSDKSKHISCHDLRHSYAVLMLREYNVSLATVASLIGDSIQVTEQYYIGYAPDNDILNMVAQKTK